MSGWRRIILQDQSVTVQASSQPQLFGNWFGDSDVWVVLSVCLQLLACWKVTLFSTVSLLIQHGFMAISS